MTKNVNAPARPPARHSRRDHVLLNRGMPGSTAPVTTPCAAALLGLQPPPGAPPARAQGRKQGGGAGAAATAASAGGDARLPDLVVIEFTTNESPAAFTMRGRQAYEALVRQVAALPSRPAVVLLHHYAWWKAEGDGAAAGLFYREPEGQLTTYSQVGGWGLGRAGGVRRMDGWWQGRAAARARGTRPPWRAFVAGPWSAAASHHLSAPAPGPAPVLPQYRSEPSARPDPTLLAHTDALAPARRSTTTCPPSRCAPPRTG